MNYPDLAFALSLLVKGRFTREANQMLRDLPPPLELSLVHRLQIENGFLRELHGRQPEAAAIARDGILLWRHYLIEQVFVVREFKLEPAFSRAAAWNAACKSKPPPWGLLFHAALAVEERTVFMSFDRGLRELGARSGLVLLPAKI